MPPEVLNFRGHLFFIADDYGFIEYTYLKKRGKFAIFSMPFPNFEVEKHNNL